MQENLRFLSHFKQNFVISNGSRVDAKAGKYVSCKELFKN